MSVRDNLSFRDEVARKALHAATAILPVGLAYGWSNQPTLRTVLTAAALLAIGIEALRRTWPAFARAFTTAFGGLLRAHERRTITGATWLALAMALVLWIAPLHAAVVALWAAAVGDATAAVVGRSAKHWQKRASNGKTLVGSLAALVVTALGALWLTPATLPVALLLGTVAAAAERPAIPLDDNLRVALAVALAATLLGLR